jgi:hypothetical protein
MASNKLYQVPKLIEQISARGEGFKKIKILEAQLNGNCCSGAFFKPAVTDLSMGSEVRFIEEEELHIRGICNFCLHFFKLFCWSGSCL